MATWRAYQMSLVHDSLRLHPNRGNVFRLRAAPRSAIYPTAFAIHTRLPFLPSYQPEYTNCFYQQECCELGFFAK